MFRERQIFFDQLCNYLLLMDSIPCCKLEFVLYSEFHDYIARIIKSIIIMWAPANIFLKWQTLA
jgi:hypothetical protein